MLFDNQLIYIINFRKKIIQSFYLFFNNVHVKNFFIYSCGSLILRSISIILAPITLSLLSPADYGLLSLVMSFTNIFVVFLGLGLRQSFSIEYFHHDEKGQIKIVNTILFIYILCSIPFLLLVLCNLDVINHILFINTASTSLLLISVLFCFIYFFVELFYQILQYTAQALQLICLQICVALTTIICNIIFLYFFKWGVEGMMFGYVIGMSISLLYAIIYFIKHRYYLLCDFRASIASISYYLKLGFPFMPSVLFGWLLSSGSRWILARYGSLHDVGIYALADMASSFYIMLILQPMSASYLPLLFKKFADAKNDIVQVERWNRANMYMSMIGMTAIITIGYIMCKPCAYYILPLKYHDAINYVWFILMGNIFLMGSYFAAALIQFKKKTYFLAIALAIPGLLNLLFNLLLIPLLHIYGCVIATMISYIFYFSIIYAYNKYLRSFN